MKQLLTPDDFARILQIPKRSVYQLVKAKKIKFIRHGRLLRFQAEDVELFLKGNLVEPSLMWTGTNGEFISTSRVNPGQKPGGVI